MHRLRPSQLALLAAVLALTACFEASTAADDAPDFLYTRHGAFDPVVAPPAFLRGDGTANIAVDGRTPHLVQFRGAIRSEWREALRAHDVQIQSYFPENALLVRVRPEAAARLQELPFVRAVLEQAPLLRIDPELLRHIDGKDLQATPDAPTEVLVELVDATHLAAVIQAVQAFGGEVTEAVADSWLVRATIPAGAASHLAARSDVAFVGPAPTLRLFNDDSRWVVQSGLTQSRRTPIWEHGLRGEGQIVAVADTGLHTGSCFFVADDKIVGYQDWASTGIGDPNGHGTHVAGSIAGDRLGNGTYDTHDGMAPAARLYIQDLGATSWGGLRAVPSDLGRLLGPAHQAGARLHNNSWGSDSNRYDSLARSLDVWVASNPDMLVLVAAGNSGPSSGTVGTPATAKNVLAVGAARNGDNAEEMASFSSRGPTADGRVKPLLTAPGVNINSARTGQDCAIIRQSGTSMASPTLAGAAALARQYFAEGYFPTGAPRSEDAFEPSAAVVKATLVAGAAPMTGSSAGTFPNQTQGFGRVHLDRALWFEGDAAARRLWVTEDAAGLAIGDEASFDLTVNAGSDLKIALIWTDPAGSTSASRALVNDLDLVVEGPAGTYHGNVFSGGRSETDPDSFDRRNVEEVVYLPNAPAGAYQVRVRAHNVPSGRQSFAVAAVGAIELEGDLGGDQGGDQGGDTGGDQGGDTGGDQGGDTGEDPVPSDPTEPDPDPSLPGPDCEIHTITPGSGQVGWVRNNDAANPHFLGDRSIYAGWWNNQRYYGVVQFDLGLPAGQEVEWVRLELTGRTSEYLNGGTFEFDVVDLRRLNGSTTFTEIAEAPIVVPTVASFDASEVGAFVENVIDLPVSAVDGEVYTLRANGRVTTHSVMGWDSGHGEGGLGILPVLSVCMRTPSLTLDAIGNKAVAEGENLAFDLTATGGAGEATFGADGLPDGAALDEQTGAFAWTPDFGQRGEYAVDFWATDGDDTVTERVRILVLATNRAPVLEHPGDLTVVEERTLSVQLEAVDPDGDIVVFYGEALPEGADLTEDGAFTWRPAQGQAGTYEVTFVATDGSASDAVQVTLEVLPVGSADPNGDPNDTDGTGRGIGFGCATGGGGAAGASLIAVLLLGLFLARPRRRAGA